MKISYNEFTKELTEYGAARVLARLSDECIDEEVLDFFEGYFGGSVALSNERVKTIGVLCSNLNFGGIASVVKQLTHIWRALGYRIVVITYVKDDNEDVVGADVKRYVISKNEVSKKLTALEKIVTSENIDVFINNEWNDMTIWDILYFRLKSIPYIQYIHGYFSLYFSFGKKSLDYPRMYRLCTMIVALSESSARFYQQCGARSFLINNPIPERLISNRRFSDCSSRHLLFVGRISDEKRPMDAIKVFKLVHDRFADTILDIAGEGNRASIAEVDRYIKENNLQECVNLLGNVHWEELERAYLSSSIILITSEMESFSMCLLESKAYGVPCVMYEMPYLTLTQGEYAKGETIVKNGDITAMSDLVIELFQNDEVRIDMGKKARESFEEFAKYDCQGAWKTVFSLCEKDQNITGYYNPANVCDNEKYIVQYMMKDIKAGYEKVFNSKSYRLGWRLFNIPRIIHAKYCKMKESTGRND